MLTTVEQAAIRLDIWSSRSCHRIGTVQGTAYSRAWTICGSFDSGAAMDRVWRLQCCESAVHTGLPM
jgi:hypothetical protein